MTSPFREGILAEELGYFWNFDMKKNPSPHVFWHFPAEKSWNPENQILMIAMDPLKKDVTFLLKIRDISAIDMILIC